MEQIAVTQAEKCAMVPLIFCGAVLSKITSSRSVGFSLAPVSPTWASRGLWQQKKYTTNGNIILFATSFIYFRKCKLKII
jgi:hypothetical protein